MLMISEETELTRLLNLLSNFSGRVSGSSSCGVGGIMKISESYSELESSFVLFGGRYNK